MVDGLRLTARWDTRIDRAALLCFTFDGQAQFGLKAVAVVSALLANGERIPSCWFKYHHRRGPFTMAGQDCHTLVQIGSEPNVRADRCVLTDGISGQALNTSHSAERAIHRVLDRLGRFFPVGFYYRTVFLQTPSIWLKFREPMIRKSAGLGVVDTKQGRGHFRKRNLQCDVLITGSGAVVIAAAMTAAGIGPEVVIAESDSEIGGQLTYNRGIEEAMPKARAELDQPRIIFLTDAKCNGWYTDNFMPVIRRDLLYRVRARQIVVVSDTQEQLLILRNNEFPGIVTAAGVQRMMRHVHLPPGRVC